MALGRPAHMRLHTAAHKFGYLVAITLNAVFFYLVNVRPGWRALPFLTLETTQVLNLLNFSLITGIVVNTVYLLYDPPWCKALGDLLLAAIGLAVLQRILWVFPFTLTGWPARLIHVVLVVAMVATVIAMITHISLLVRRSAGKTEQR